MRVAVAGKGGAGKTTITATAARLLARSGRQVVAIDGDSNPNLGAALGLDRATVRMARSLPSTLVARRFDGPALAAPLADVLAELAVEAPDGVSVLRMGVPEHPDEGCLCSAHATVSALLADLGGRPEIVTLLDLEASPEHLSRGTARHADVLALVAEPYFRSLEAVRLQAALAAETAIGRVVVIANKCRSATDVEAIEVFADRHGLELIGVVPWSDRVLDADAASTALIDFDGRGPVVEAIREIIALMIEPAAARNHRAADADREVTS